MKPRDYILAAINHEEIRPVPFTLAIEPEVRERVDRWYGDSFWQDRLPSYIANVAVVDTDRKTRLDETRVRDPYGGIWRVDRLPWHLETPPLSQPTLDGYGFPEPEDFFMSAEHKEGVRRYCEESQDYFRIGHLGWGLFERSWNLRGFENILMDSICEPDFFDEVLDRLMNLYLAFVDYTADLPIDGILFGDDWGDQRGIILGPDRWRRFIKPRWARIYEAVHAKGKIVMSHSCGSVAEIIPDLVEIGLDVLESVQPEAAGMNPYELKKRFGRNITFWGCLGSQSTIPFGTPDQIKAEINRLCSEMGQGGGYILAPAKPLQPETPTENAVAIIEAFAHQDR